MMLEIKSRPFNEEKIRTLKDRFPEIDDNQLKDMYVVSVVADGNCGPRAMIQSLFIQGLLQGSEAKKKVVDFIQRLVKERSTECEQFFKLTQPEGLERFLKDYNEVQPKEISAFIENKLSALGKADTNRIILYLSSCLRLDMASYSKESLEKQKVERQQYIWQVERRIELLSDTDPDTKKKNEDHLKNCKADHEYLTEEGEQQIKWLMNLTKFINIDNLTKEYYVDHQIGLNVYALNDQSQANLEKLVLSKHSNDLENPVVSLGIFHSGSKEAEHSNDLENLEVFLEIFHAGSKEAEHKEAGHFEVLISRKDFNQVLESSKQGLDIKRQQLDHKQAFKGVSNALNRGKIEQQDRSSRRGSDFDHSNTNLLKSDKIEESSVFNGHQHALSAEGIEKSEITKIEEKSFTNQNIAQSSMDLEKDKFIKNDDEFLAYCVAAQEVLDKNLIQEEDGQFEPILLELSKITESSSLQSDRKQFFKSQIFSEQDIKSCFKYLIKCQSNRYKQFSNLKNRTFFSKQHQSQDTTPIVKRYSSLSSINTTE